MPAKQKKPLRFRRPGLIEHIYDDDFEGEYQFDEFDEFDNLSDDDTEDELSPEDLKKVIAAQQQEITNTFKYIESIAAPILFTLLGFAVRVYRIGINDTVVWDEAHFGKFGSYYLRHEFYHDVHPPLGKMLVGFSGYLAGYNGSWDFPSGETYPKEIAFIKMRLFQAVFSTVCVPFAYLTAKEIGFGILPTWLFTLMVALEQSYVTLGRFILLDAMLLCFTVTTMFCFVKFHNESAVPFSKKWWKWILFLGISIGCVDSVKMVGFFITLLVGIYTIVQLWQYWGDQSMSKTAYFYHWIARIFLLMIVPLTVFALCFKIHFELLWKSGTGDANMNSLFQANLAGSDVATGPRNVVIGSSRVTLKSQAMNGGLLHSHVQTYPGGSEQQQVTTYSHKDTNNNWLFQRRREVDAWNPYNDVEIFDEVYDGMVVRIYHESTGTNLHTHELDAPVTKKQWEVSCYGSIDEGDEKDNWIVEIVSQYGNENALVIHPLTTTFTLRNQVLDCYLGTSGANYPDWGFGQGEVVCFKKNSLRGDRRNIYWNVENHQNSRLSLPPADFLLPKTSFWNDFIELNMAMMATNNALVPDAEKLDELASLWWQWPSLHTGIRLCGWDDDTIKYYLIGSPATTWPSTIAVGVIFPIIFIYYLLRWQRQYQDFPDSTESTTGKWNLFLMGGVYPMLGWGLHYTPFVIMGRVTYVHHYLPALYFAMLVYVYVFELGVSRLNSGVPTTTKKFMYFTLYLMNFALIAMTFRYFSPLSFGMEGPNEDFGYLNWLPSWKISDEKRWDWNYDS